MAGAASDKAAIASRISGQYTADIGMRKSRDLWWSQRV